MFQTFISNCGKDYKISMNKEKLDNCCRLLKVLIVTKADKIILNNS